MSTIVGPKQDNTRNNRVLSSIDNRDYVGLSGVDFGSEGARSVKMSVASATGESVEGKISVYCDSMTSANKVGEINVKAGKDFTDVTDKLSKTFQGTHKLDFKFNMSGILVDTWSLSTSEDAE